MGGFRGQEGSSPLPLRPGSQVAEKPPSSRDDQVVSLAFCCRASRLCFHQLTRSHNAACVHNMEAPRPAEATLLVLASQAG